MLNKKATKEIALQVKEARERIAGRKEFKNVLRKMGVRFVVFDNEGDMLISDEKPTVEELTAKVLCALYAQNEILKGIKSAFENAPTEIYLDELLKGQDSTNKKLVELFQAAERIANNTTEKE